MSETATPEDQNGGFEPPVEVPEPEPDAKETVERLPVVERTEHPSLQAAMIHAYAEIEPIGRTAEGQVGTRTYAYATLAEIQMHVRPVLARHGLAVFQQAMTRVENNITMAGCEIEIMHVTGEVRRSEFMLPVPNATAQAVGSATTYARRYSYPFAIQADESDDDGAAASNGSYSRGNAGGNYQSSGPPADDGLPIAGTQTGGARQEEPPIDQSEPPEEMIGRTQAITLTGIATRRASDFDGVSGKDILNDIAEAKGQGNWEAMWPRIKMRQLEDVSKVIQSWEPPATSE